MCRTLTILPARQTYGLDLWILLSREEVNCRFMVGMERFIMTSRFSAAAGCRSGFWIAPIYQIVHEAELLFGMSVSMSAMSSSQQLNVLG